MAEMKVLTGNQAIAEAIVQISPDMIASFPIPPASGIVEKISKAVADGDSDIELLHTESEHSALSACIGASCAGGRIFTASCSQGLLLMQEVLFIAASFRCPIVMAVTNRAISSPLNIHADHMDTISQRDTGWIQIYSENSQEAYDNIIQAFKIAENMDVRTPVMVCTDSFITSHSLENVAVETSEDINKFIGAYSPETSILETENPKTIGSTGIPEYYFEFKMNQALGIENSRQVIREVGKEFGDIYGRYYGYFETYKLDDAEYAVVSMGSTAGTVKESVDQQRKNGEKVGALKLRVFRPFPVTEIMEALSGLKAVAVLDRALATGAYGGPLFTEIRSSLQGIESSPLVYPYIYGIGGRDISIQHIVDVWLTMKNQEIEAGYLPEIRYLNLSEE